LDASSQSSQTGSPQLCSLYKEHVTDLISYYVHVVENSDTSHAYRNNSDPHRKEGAITLEGYRLKKMLAFTQRKIT
jgi:hypothetical protein